MKYFIERKLNYEELQKSSALVFGVGIDEALNYLLETFRDGELDIEGAKTMFKTSIKCMFKSTEHYFFKADFDFDIITEKQAQIGLDYLAELDYDGTLDIEVLHTMLFKKIIENKKDYSVITKNQQLFISCVSTLSLKQKGIMMIDAYVEKVLPRIEKVISVQRETENRSGFIDIELELKGFGRVTADHKTASNMNRNNNIEYAPQLLLYDYEANNKQIAYIVLGKNVMKNTEKTCSVCGFNGNGLRHKTCPNEPTPKKRCDGAWDIMITPEIDIDIRVGDVNEKLQDVVLRSITSVEKAVHLEAFPLNLESCPNQFGKPCPYKDYCHNGSAKKMKKKKPRKDKK
jgi:hypothetical protein